MVNCQWSIVNRLMHRQSLLQKLSCYSPIDDQDKSSCQRIIDFVTTEPNCFKRSLLKGHITASAWLVNQAESHVLLTHHKKLNKWIQLGGHADGESDVLKVAFKEAREESGIENIVAVSEDIFDVDVHLIPQNPKEGEHWHYDIRFALKTQDSDEFKVSDESHGLKWIAISEIPSMNLENSIVRMAQKYQALQADR